MKGSLTSVGFFVLGIACGLWHLLPDMSSWGNMSFYTLCAVLFCVGLSVGGNGELLRSFRRLDRRLLLLPLMTIAGTLAGCAIMAFALPRRGFGIRLLLAIEYPHHAVSRR